MSFVAGKSFSFFLFLAFIHEKLYKFEKQKNHHTLTNNRKERLTLIYSFFPSLFGLTSLEAASMMGEAVTYFLTRPTSIVCGCVSIG